MANVYVFNCYSEPIISLSVNGWPAAGNIAGWASGSSPAKAIYTPSSVAVPRSISHGSSAPFAVGENSLVASWQSFGGRCVVAIPDDLGPNDPLLLYLTVNQAMLLATNGYVLAQFAVRRSMSGQAPEATP